MNDFTKRMRVTHERYGAGTVEGVTVHPRRVWVMWDETGYKTPVNADDLIVIETITPDRNHDHAALIAEMREAGEANQRRLSLAERSRGAISQIRAKQETVRREIRNEIIRAAYALGVELSATDIQFTWDNHAAIAGMPAVEWLYEAAITDGTEEAADEVAEKLSELRQPKYASRIGLVVSE